MDRINLQAKTKALPGVIECYAAQSPHTRAREARIHRLMIPLQLFDSGLDYEEQPVDTVLLFDHYLLKLSAPGELGGLNLSHDYYPDAEASVYLGNAHNRCEVERLELEHIQSNEFKVSGDLLIDFENEMVAENERFSFVTTAAYQVA
ncbi:hypothetical protein [Aliidiomarina soli]|uniref:Uncharacterized protein n=1 Tax=Aliidiomarina soli TaxID=1928574 RepID=A0A432WLZ7_9GAMM|nr:hypothetical protein [Aliidiomarina soli]RUO34813.1 hypothetical protein CWE14_02100 [Aliidiomarina soli]